MRNFKTLALAASIALLFAAQAAYSSTRELSEATARVNESIGRQIGDHTLVDQDGREFGLKELAGRPVVISYVYTGCAHVCPAIVARLRGVFESSGGDFGTRFTALTIGFDAENDTPSAMRAYGKNFTDDFGAWRFAAADEQTIKALTGELGFYYEKRADGGFDHLNLVTVVSGEGKVAGQVFGTNFDREALMEAIRRSYEPGAPALTRPVGIIDRVKLFCYRYDENTGEYRLDFGAVTALTAVTATQLVVIGWIVRIIFKKT